MRKNENKSPGRCPLLDGEARFDKVGRLAQNKSNNSQRGGGNRRRKLKAFSEGGGGMMGGGKCYGL